MSRSKLIIGRLYPVLVLSNRLDGLRGSLWCTRNVGLLPSAIKCRDDSSVPHSSLEGCTEISYVMLVSLFWAKAVVKIAEGLYHLKCKLLLCLTFEFKKKQRNNFGVSAIVCFCCDDRLLYYMALLTFARLRSIKMMHCFNSSYCI